MRDIDEISGDGLDTALRLHRALGFGLLESVYAVVLARKREQRGYGVARLVNFAGATLKEGVRRLVDDHHPASPRLRANQPSSRG